MFRPSDRQTYIMRFDERDYDHTFVVGPFGTGKTATCVRAFMAWAATELADAHLLVTAKSQKQMDMVLAAEAKAFLDESKLRGTIGATRWVVESLCGPPNTFTPVVFADGDVAVNRVRGMNLSGALVDEATAMPTPVRSMIMSRLRVGAKPRALWTMNPDSPLHPFKVDMIDSEDVNGEEINTAITDNPSLPPGYVDQLKAAYPLEHDQQRYLYGRWASASGLVYPQAHMRHPAGNVRPLPASEVPWAYSGGVDWASKTVTHALLVASCSMGHVVVAEWRWDARERGMLSEADQAERIAKKFSHVSVKQWVVDQSSKGLIVALRNEVRGDVHASGLEVYDGVNRVSHLFNTGRLWVAPSCPELVRELSNYSWPDKNKESYGRVKPVKRDDHGCDALRYWAERVDMPGARRQRGRVDVSPGM